MGALGGLRGSSGGRISAARCLATSRRVTRPFPPPLQPLVSPTQRAEGVSQQAQPTAGARRSFQKRSASAVFGRTSLTLRERARDFIDDVQRLIVANAAAAYLGTVRPRLEISYQLLWGLAICWARRWRLKAPGSDRATSRAFPQYCVRCAIAF